MLLFILASLFTISKELPKRVVLFFSGGSLSEQLLNHLLYIKKGKAQQNGISL
jgi:hypothetical protein